MRSGWTSGLAQKLTVAVGWLGGFASLALPGRVAADSLVYSNTAAGNFFSPGAANTPVADDLRTTVTCGCDLSSYRIRVAGGGVASGVFTATVSLWTGCPAGSGQPIPGTQAVFDNLLDAGWHDLTVDLSAAPVPIPHEVWLHVEFDTGSAGVFVGAAPESGYSEDSFYHPGVGCNADFGGALYAAFYSQLFCADPIGPPSPANPDPPDGATDVPFDAVLSWSLATAVRARPGGEPRAASPIVANDAPTDWVNDVPPGQWCATYEQYRARNPLPGSATGRDVCPLDGACDLATVRDQFTPDITTPLKTVRIMLNVFCNDDGSGCLATAPDIASQMATLNADYAPWRIQFVHEVALIHSTSFRNFEVNEEGLMKALYADSPGSKLNIYLVNHANEFSVATFPWDADALTDQGGVILHAAHFGPLGTTLAHEVGHALGLWHTHHGVNEVLFCGDCFEYEGSNSDDRGDRCSDTEPTPRNYNCADPGSSDGCSGLPWGATPYTNYMGYAPSACRTEFTPQQMGRAHCWTEQVLSAWLQQGCDTTYDVYFGTVDPPTTLLCDDIAVPTCDPGPLACGTTYYWQVLARAVDQTTAGPVWYFSSLGGGDCNNNAVPDLCEPDCQSNGVPDDCDIAAGTSLDCQPNGLPDECDISSGTSLDNNGNFVPDECDCPVAAAPLTEGIAACATAADCTDVPCVGGRCYIPKNRYLSLSAADMPPGVPHALRVTHVASGRRWWVAAHQPGDPADRFRLAAAPACADWSMAPAAIHVGDCGIVPVAEYDVQAIHCTCDFDRELNYSAPVRVPTIYEPTPKKWADVVGGLVAGSWTPPDGVVNFDDVVAALTRFQTPADGPPLPWVDLHDEVPNGAANFGDVFLVVKGFQGQPYIFRSPPQCP